MQRRAASRGASNERGEVNHRLPRVSSSHSAGHYATRSAALTVWVVGANDRPPSRAASSRPMAAGAAEIKATQLELSAVTVYERGRSADGSDPLELRNDIVAIKGLRQARTDKIFRRHFRLAAVDGEITGNEADQWLAAQKIRAAKDEV